LRTQLYALAVSPEGEVVAGVGPTSLHFWDAATLAELARFEPRATFVASLAFTGDGQLLAGTRRGLGAWPWRELVGRR
jgi:hypothetical protein